ncbi:hypothetical protein [Aureliella helgolandensis]|uniref:Uncharacterized protein n=1 Tax=Aureliella helgolandensis TaxID=2527968 RepID=A0A518GGY2_9BACT|nr:hypothetical protein [Aureliella helgolandensis]QDV27818.1 hypothetical protein Q31a_62110 [Aureliella helgolandensis]
MRKLLGTIMIGVILIGIVGLARGWFSVSTDTESEEPSIQLKIDKDRFKEDADRLKSGVQDLKDRVQTSPEDGSEVEVAPAPGPSTAEPSERAPVLPPTQFPPI